MYKKVPSNRATARHSYSSWLRPGLLLLCSTLICSAVPTQVRQIYLPLVNQQEATQIVRLPITNLHAQLITLRCPCFAKADQPVYTVTDMTSIAEIQVDLKVAAQASSFNIQVVNSNNNEIIQDIRCHLSLVPFQVQINTSSNQFSLVNLTSKPWTITKTNNLVIQTMTPSIISGIFRPNARIQFKDHGIINIQTQNYAP